MTAAAEPMAWVVALLLLQAALGAFDTLVDHEWRARLPATPGAAPELRLHALRSTLYATLFATAAAADWSGAWALLPLGVSAAEIGVTARDTVIEFRLRRIDALERIVHLLLLLNTGAYTLALVLAAFGPDAATSSGGGPLRWLLAAAALGALASALRDGRAATRRRRLDERDPGRGGTPSDGPERMPAAR